MPRKPRTAPTADAPLALIPSEVLEQFVHRRPRTPQEAETAVRQFKKAVVERALGAELSHHFRQVSESTGRGHWPRHPGANRAAATIEYSQRPMEMPLFDPRVIARRERFTGVDDQIVALYARGLTISETQTCLAEMYAVEVSLDAIGAVTDAVAREVATWQRRPLEPMYPVVFFDALRVRIRDKAVVPTRAVYVALAILQDGTRDILGLWIEQSQGPSFWREVVTDLKVRGCHDILIAVTDRPQSVDEALGAVFPATTLQTSIVPLIRHSLDFVAWKERTALAAALRPVYMAPDATAARLALDALECGPWGATIPTVLAAWRRAWADVARVFTLPPEIRRVIYSMTALETVRTRLRTVIKERGHFPSEDSVTTPLCLSLRTIAAAWVRPAASWKSTRNQFAILYGDRFTQGEL